MTEREVVELAERLSRLEEWAHDFSCRVEHADCPIFIPKAVEDEMRERDAAMRARAR